MRREVVRGNLGEMECYGSGEGLWWRWRVVG